MRRPDGIYPPFTKEASETQGTTRLSVYKDRMTQPPRSPSSHSSKSARVRRWDWAYLMRTGGIFPVVVVTCISLTVLTTLGYLVHRIITDHGLMPPASTLQSYACEGFASPLVLEFRHGLDVARLRAGSIALEGQVVNDHITWSHAEEAAAKLGFEPPADVVYIDARSLRVLGADRMEKTCTLQR